MRPAPGSLAASAQPGRTSRPGSLSPVRGAGLALAAVLLLALPADACPVCDTRTGQAVRQGIFDDRFGVNVLLTLLPFPVFLAIVAALYRAIPARPPEPPEGITPGDLETGDLETCDAG